MKKILFLLVCFSLLIACSSNKYVANIGQSTDSISTAIALSNGFSEANPIVDNNLWILGVKPFLPELIRLLPEESCVASNQILAHGGFIPGIHNIFLMLGAPSPVTWFAAIVSIPIMYQWIKEGSEMRCQDIHIQ